MGNQIEIEVVGRSKGLDKVESDAKAAGRKIGDGISKGMEEAGKAGGRASKQIRDDLGKVEEAGKQAGQGLADSFTDALSGLGDMIGGQGGGMLSGLTDSLMSGKGALLGAGLAVGGMIMDGMAQVWEKDRVGGLIAAQTGQAGEAAGRMGDIAGSLFANSFGESIADAGAAVTAVIQNDLIPADAADAAIERVTSKVLTISEVVGEEANTVARSARQLLVNGLAGNVAEAMDMIQHASEEGLNTAGDMFDTIDEYASQFARLGVDGAEAFGLLGQAQRGGARDTDFAADAIKEFAIIAQDTASNATRGFQAIGLDGQKMGRMIAAGGEPARQALEQTLNALRAMPPGIERNSAAVDLFGTKAEDLGNALFEMDLDTAAAQFGNYAGSVEEAAQKMAAGQSAAEKMGKGFDKAEEDAAEFLMTAGNWGEFGSKMDNAVAKGREFNAAMAQLKDTGSAEYFDELKAKYPELAGQIDEVVEKIRGQAETTEQAADANIDYAGTFDDIIEAQQELANQYLGLSEASISAQEALADANETAQEFAGQGLNAAKDGFDLTTEAGRANQEALNDVAKTTQDVINVMREEGATAQEVTNYTNGQRGSFIALARSMGMSKAGAEQLANALFGIPRKVPVSVQVQIDRAAQQVRAFKAELASIPRNIPVSVQVDRQDIALRGASHRAHGGIVSGYASGGVVSPTPDIPRAASGGVRSATVMVNDGAGIGEVINVPDGSTVIPAGTTRALAERGLLGGGGGGGVHVTFDFTGASNSWAGQFFQEGVRKGHIRLNVNGQRVKAG